MSKYSSIKRGLVLLATVVIFNVGFATAQPLDKAELKKLIGTASTAQDHEKIALHYDSKATQFEAEAIEHDELAAQYTAHPNGHEQKHPMSGLTAGHCKVFAAKAREAAQAARQLARDHRQMAKPTN